jgi:hypothetical protein
MVKTRTKFNIPTFNGQYGSGGNYRRLKRKRSMKKRRRRRGNGVQKGGFLPLLALLGPLLGVATGKLIDKI